MANFRDLTLNQESVNEREGDAVIPDDFPNELSLDVMQNLELDENMLEVMHNRRTEEGKSLLVLIFELKGETINLLELHLKLLEYKHKKFKNEVNKVVDRLNNIILKFQNLPKPEEIDDKHDQFREKLKSLTIVSKQFEGIGADMEQIVLRNDEDKFLDEMHESFLKYQEAYKNCVLHVNNFLQKAENLKISNVPRESQEELCVLFSVLEENVNYYRRILLSSKDEFDNFELILKNDLESSSQDLNKRIALFISAIKKGELAYINLKPILFDILHLECALGVNF